MKKQKQKLNPKLVGIFDHLIDKDAPVPQPVTRKSREIPRQLVMFWRKEKCLRCHAVYEGSLYHSEPLLQLEIQKPIVHFGRQYGWKYVGTEFRPVQDVSCFNHLPHSVEEVQRTIRICPKCAYRPKVIYLPQEIAS